MKEIINYDYIYFLYIMSARIAQLVGVRPFI